MSGTELWLEFKSRNMPVLTAEPFCNVLWKPAQKEGRSCQPDALSPGCSCVRTAAHVLTLESRAARKDHHTQSCAFHSILSRSSRQGLFRSMSVSVELREHDLNIESDVIL